MTSIEYLFTKLWNTDKDKLMWHSIFKQAEEMHKAEIIDAYSAGEDNIDNDGCTIGRNGKETYYNEKFKKDL
jgi:hypothetical protein